MALDETQIERLKASGLQVGQSKSLQTGRTYLSIYTHNNYIDFSAEMAEALANLMQDVSLAGIKFTSIGHVPKVRFQEGALDIFAKAVKDNQTLESIKLYPSNYELPDVSKALEDAVCLSNNRNLNQVEPFTDAIKQIIERNSYEAKLLLGKMHNLESLTKDDCARISSAFSAIQAEMDRQSDGYDFTDNAKLLFRVKAIGAAHGVEFPELSYSQRMGVKDESQRTDGGRSVAIGNRVYRGRPKQESYADFIAANPQSFVRR